MTDCRSLLGLTESAAVQILEAGSVPWTVKRCRALRDRPEDCLERVVRARLLEDGTVEVTLSGFCDYPRGGKESRRGENRNGSAT